MKLKYDWILFDADETLFHFDDFMGLHRMFQRYQVTFTKEDYAEYKAINKPLWVAYQQGRITAPEIQIRRFQSWADKLDIHPQILNHAFLDAMAEIAASIEGAKELMHHLHGQYKLGIITNGFTQLQEIRLDATGFKQFFDMVVISEQVGKAKPDPLIFNHALEKMGSPIPRRVLMVGDNLHSDIIGGNRAGFDTCWYNPDRLQNDSGICSTYHIHQLMDLISIL